LAVWQSRKDTNINPADINIKPRAPGWLAAQVPAILCTVQVLQETYPSLSLSGK